MKRTPTLAGRSRQIIARPLGVTFTDTVADSAPGGRGVEATDHGVGVVERGGSAVDSPLVATTKTKDGSLDALYQELRRLLLAHIPPFMAGGDEQGTFRGKQNFHLVVPKAVVIPGAYGGKPIKLCMASLVVQQGYVGFYLNAMNPALKPKLSPALLKLLKGKTCFHVKKLDATLLGDIAAALTLGAKYFRERGWV